MHNISFSFKITFRRTSISEAKLLHINVHKCALRSQNGNKIGYADEVTS